MDCGSPRAKDLDDAAPPKLLRYKLDGIIVDITGLNLATVIVIRP